MANQQQGSKRRAQDTRKRPASRTGQVTAARGAAANAYGQARRSSARQGAADIAATRRPWTPRWLPITALSLCLIGLGLGIYLTIAHLAGAQILPCSNKGFVDCAAVTTSPESKVFGIFPVAELGLGFFFAMTLLNLPWIWRPTWSWLPKRLKDRELGLESRLPVYAWRLRLGGIIAGILFILYLIYTELITLRQICLFCTYTHITTFLLFVLLIVQAASWGDPSKAPASRQASR
jgi:uncharacterized membrane protein